ncbi:MAG TPA: type II toxin-antitoxin system HicA family toxin [Roseiarcus sp.]|nr:type II toxin-antitoxin system HicA family toxin [Roseiarcus sp.]
MPRLRCNFGRFVTILLEHGFELHRQGATNHRQYRAVVGGEVRIVTVAGHRDNDDILPDTLSSMIRQSGLPRALFRN